VFVLAGRTSLIDESCSTLQPRRSAGKNRSSTISRRLA
jgi:hypothetical protein